jgi:uncharacterized protein YkwD
MLPNNNRLVPFVISILLFATACTKEAPLEPQLPEEPTTQEPGTVPVFENNVNKEVLLSLINNVRAKGCNCGGDVMPPVEPLKWNLYLELAAANHSKDMLTRKYFAHNSPNGVTPQKRIADAGYKASWSGENIASGPATEQAVIDGWLKSAGHCKNIMSANYKDVAVARAGNIWTQTFGATYSNQ